MRKKKERSIVWTLWGIMTAICSGTGYLCYRACTQGDATAPIVAGIVLVVLSLTGWTMAVQWVFEVYQCPVSAENIVLLVITVWAFLLLYPQVLHFFGGRLW